MAERAGKPILTICSTCQGVMSQANARLQDEEYRASINEDLAEEGLRYDGTAEPKHLLWVIVEDIGIDKLRSMVTQPLPNLKLAPFYGCYIVRPSSALGFDEHPEREDSLERVIEAVGAQVVDFPGKTLCCGFPILTINETNSLKMVSTHTLDAKGRGADAMVTPCPLCHLNLDGYQPQAAKANSPQSPIDVPILHLPQLIGLAMGIDPKAMRPQPPHRLHKKPPQRASPVPLTSTYCTGRGGCHHAGASLTSISVTHFIHSKPRLPGATSLIGYP